MGSTATIEHTNATTTSFALDANGRIVIAAQSTGPRTQEYDQAGLTAAAKCCAPDSEGQAMFSARAAALVEQAPAPQNTPGAPGFVMKQNFT